MKNIILNIMPGHYKNKIRDTFTGFFSGKVFWGGFYEEICLPELEKIQAADNGLYQTIEEQNINKK